MLWVARASSKALGAALENLRQAFGADAVDVVSEFHVAADAGSEVVSVLVAQRPNERVAAFAVDLAVDVPDAWLLRLLSHLS